MEGLDHLSRLLKVTVMTERACVLGEREQPIGFLGALCDLYVAQQGPRPMQQRLDDLVLASAPGLSIATNLNELARLARNARAYLSGDTWLLVQDLRRQVGVKSLVTPARFGALDRIARTVTAHVNALTGTFADNMMRDAAWNFVDIGRRLQRTVMLSNVLTTIANVPVSDGHDLLYALEIADSAVTWRARYGRRPDYSGVFELLAQNADNPRSVLFQLKTMEQRLRALPAGEAFGDPPCK